MAKNKNEVTNPETGEIVVFRGTGLSRPRPVKTAVATPLDQLVGKNPPAVNLKDHKEFSGKMFQIANATPKASTLNGEATTYMILEGYMYNEGSEPKDEDYIKIMTGSENVCARIIDALSVMGEGSPFPLTGKLRCSQGGRAWFLD